MLCVMHPAAVVCLRRHSTPRVVHGPCIGSFVFFVTLSIALLCVTVSGIICSCFRIVLCGTIRGRRVGMYRRILSPDYCVLCSTTSVSHDGNLATRVSPFISAPTMTNIAQYFHPFGINKRNSVPGSNVPNGCTPKRRRMKCFRLPSEISNVSAFDPNSGWLVPSLSSDVKRFTLH